MHSTNYTYRKVKMTYNLKWEQYILQVLLYYVQTGIKHLDQDEYRNA
jgi:hypothetical protein